MTKSTVEADATVLNAILAYIFSCRSSSSFFLFEFLQRKMNDSKRICKDFEGDGKYEMNLSEVRPTLRRSLKNCLARR